MSSQYGELWSTNSWDWLASLEHPSKFQRFCALASLLHWRCLMEINQILHDLWPSPGLVHFGGSWPLTECCRLENSLCVQVLHSPILAALLHSTRAVGVSHALWRGIFHDRVAIPFDIGQLNCLVVDIMLPYTLSWVTPMTSGLGCETTCNNNYFF